MKQDNRSNRPVRRQMTQEEREYLLRRRAKQIRMKKLQRARRIKKLVMAGSFLFLAAVGIMIGVMVVQRDQENSKRQNITLFAPENETAADSGDNTQGNTAAAGKTSQNRDYGVTLPETFQNPPVFESSFTMTGDSALDSANRLAAMYDYDGAIAKIQSISGYQNKDAYVKAIAEYEDQRSQLYRWQDNHQITHIFFHTLIVDPAKTFDPALSSNEQVKAYNEAMTTVNEYVDILEKMYDEGYVLVGLHDIAEMELQPDGTECMVMKPIYLPEGKKPFVLSQDDVCYYEYMTGQGFPDRLVIGKDGKVTNEYTLDDGTVIQGSFDVLPILEDFIEAHPDFSYKGAKGTIAVTGYNGVLGYRTSDFWYNWNCEYFDPSKAEERQRMYYNNENIEADKAEARKVADAIKAQGWTIASHSWGHIYIGSSSYERVVWDSNMWETEVAPIVGETDIIIFAFGEDLDSFRGYAADNPKYLYLKQLGFDYFCNVDALNPYWVQIGANKDYFRQARRNLDGTRMWEAIESYTDTARKNRLTDLFDAREVFDPARPTPVE